LYPQEAPFTPWGFLISSLTIFRGHVSIQNTHNAICGVEDRCFSRSWVIGSSGRPAAYSNSPKGSPFVPWGFFNFQAKSILSSLLPDRIRIADIARARTDKLHMLRSSRSFAVTP